MPMCHKHAASNKCSNLATHCSSCCFFFLMKFIRPILSRHWWDHCDLLLRIEQLKYLDQVIVYQRASNTTNNDGQSTRSKVFAHSKVMTTLEWTRVMCNVSTKASLAFNKSAQMPRVFRKPWCQMPWSHHWLVFRVGCHRNIPKNLLDTWFSNI